MSEFDKCYENIDGKASAYHYLGSSDRHIVNLFHWIETLEKLSDEVKSSEMDYELEKEILHIINRLTNEVGVRVKHLFP